MTHILSHVGAEAGDDLRQRLAAARVRERLVVLDRGLTALMTRRDADHLLPRQATIDLVEARAVVWFCLGDPSWRVRRRLARRLSELDWQESFPLVTRLAWDPDHRVRDAVVLSLGDALVLSLDSVRPLLASFDSTGSQQVLELASLHPPPPAPPLFESSHREPLAGEVASEPPPNEPPSEPPPSDPPPGKPPPGEPPPGEPAAGDGEEVVRRYTDCDFTADAEYSSSGHVAFALRMKAIRPDSRPIDLRVPPGKESVPILVHAFSDQFEVESPDVRVIKVPRAADSDTATFTVRADKPSVGEVELLVYDENRLIGSLSLQLSAVPTPQGLRLEKTGKVIFRDPALTAPAPAKGITLQVSLRSDSRIAIDILQSDQAQQPTLFPLGWSGEPLETPSVKKALDALRERVAEIHDDLEHPTRLGVATVDQALELVRVNLAGPGHIIARDIIPRGVLELLVRLRQGSLVHWVLKNSGLDAVPWELAWNPRTHHHLNEDLVLVRVPVRNPEFQFGEVEGAALTTKLPPARDRLYYVLGPDVALGDSDSAPQLMQDIVQSVGGFQVTTNFPHNRRQSVNVLQLKEEMSKAQVVHILCHGLVEEKTDSFYLKLGEKAAEKLYASQVEAFHLPPNALVFVNSCSSSTASNSFRGLTSFGWSFFNAGAYAYIGTLAPVTTKLACLFAKAFFEAHLDRKEPLAKALYETRLQFAAEVDPTWLLYTLYGDLSQEPPTLKVLPTEARS